MATLLLVDDDKYFREITKRQLQKHGYTVVEAFDGPSAKQQLANHPIELILLDYMLPGATGDRVAMEIVTSGIKLPFIFISGADPQVLSAIDFNGLLMPKPLNTLELVDNIEKLLSVPKTASA